MANFRQQTNSALGTSTVCSACFTTLFLCFSSVSANELCCGISSNTTVYVPSGQTFQNATNLYATTSLSGGALAASGWYSDDAGSCVQ